MNFASHIDHEEVNALPLRSFEGEIHVVTTPREADEAVRRLVSCKHLGFDTETKPTFRKGKLNPVSLLQLSSRHEAFLFRINRLGYHEGLGRLLANPGIIKIGAAIHDDIRALQGLFPGKAEGFIDLQDFVQQYGIESIGVKKMAAIVLGFRISKSQQLSNWDAEVLTDPQKVYAATDAWVSLEIYLKLIQNGNP